MSHIAATHAGTFFHRESLEGDRYSHYIDELIYAPEFGAADLDNIDILIITDRTPARLLVPHRNKINAFLNRGFLVVLGECDAHQWLANIRWTPTPTNYWWWLHPDSDSGLRLAAPEHPLFAHIDLTAATWHHHGYLVPPPGARSLINLSAHDRHAGSVLYDDTANYGGRLLASTLDPCYHHGSNFMPATTRFLDGFLPWLRSQ